ncbi:MAG: hypothetical protein DRO18_05090 [Thermoprotei archaeon]|nr:MAG: hypothetical protein DRO18_05090 [Thermoprotei archaeon]
MKTWSELTWIELRELIESKKYKVIALLPVGSIEQHGPHLPLGTDFMIADKVASLLVNKIKEVGSKVYLLKLPPIPYGLSIMWKAYKGTITLTPQVFIELVKSIIKEVISQGVKAIIILNAHVGNEEALRIACREAIESLGKGLVVYVNIWDVVGDVINEVFETKFFHADEVETSLAMVLGLNVEKDLISKGCKPHREYDDFWHSLDLTKRPKVHMYKPEASLRVCNGAFGRPDLASPQKGLKLLNKLIERLTNLVIKVATQ